MNYPTKPRPIEDKPELSSAEMIAKFMRTQYVTQCPSTSQSQTQRIRTKGSKGERGSSRAKPASHC